MSLIIFIKFKRKNKENYDFKLVIYNYLVISFVLLFIFLILIYFILWIV